VVVAVVAVTDSPTNRNSTKIVVFLAPFGKQTATMTTTLDVDCFPAV
jgi:hypothetical protein